MPPRVARDLARVWIASDEPAVQALGRVRSPRRPREITPRWARSCFRFLEESARTTTYKPALLLRVQEYRRSTQDSGAGSFPRGNLALSLRPSIMRWWADNAAQRNPDVEHARSRLEFGDFLFGRDRAGARAVAEGLLDLNTGRACTATGTSDASVRSTTIQRRRQNRAAKASDYAQR